MLSWVILILVVALVCVAGAAASTHLFGRGEVLPPLEASPEVQAANRCAADRGDVGAIRFEVVHRGYSMEQVDDLIRHLAGARAENSVDLGETPAVEGEVIRGSNETPHR